MASSVDAKILRKTKFPPEFNQKVDMQKVNIEVMKRWIAQRMSEILRSEDDIVIELCYNLLEGSRFPDIKKLQIQLTGFLDKDTGPFCKEMWNLFLSAQENPQGVPKELLEAKKLELLQEKVNAEKAAQTARQSRDIQNARDRDLNRIREQERGDRGSGRSGGRGGGRGGRQFDDRRPQWNSGPDRDAPRERGGPKDRGGPSWGGDSFVPSRDDRREPPKRRPRSRTPTASRSRSTSRSSRGATHRRRRSATWSRSPSLSRSRSRSRSPTRKRSHRPRRRRSHSTASTASSRGRKRRYSSSSRSRSRSLTRSPPPKRLRSLDRTDRKGRLSRDSSPAYDAERQSGTKKKTERRRSRSRSRSRSASSNYSSERKRGLTGDRRPPRREAHGAVESDRPSTVSPTNRQPNAEKKTIAQETGNRDTPQSESKPKNTKDNEAQTNALRLREALLREKVKALRRESSDNSP